MINLPMPYHNKVLVRHSKSMILVMKFLEQWLSLDAKKDAEMVEETLFVKYDFVARKKILMDAGNALNLKPVPNLIF